MDYFLDVAEKEAKYEYGEGNNNNNNNNNKHCTPFGVTRIHSRGLFD